MGEPASRIGRYEILREIGRGAMGVVYEASDPALNRTVALKVIQLAAGGDPASTLEERFLAEARIAARLQHPGIVVVHDVGVDPASGSTFIALELLRGETLADLGEKGPVNWRTVMQLVAQVARALHHAHLQGVVHRDIKPANVVVLPSGEAKVMDFGIARLEGARQRLTTTGEFVGTPLYMAPEQAKHEEVDGRADVFSLASVAYTLLTGHAAFLGPSVPAIVHRVVYEDPEPPSRFVHDLPSDVARVLAHAMAKDPARRYPSADALAEDAEDVLAGRTPRHAGVDELAVEEEPDSPLAALLAEETAPVAGDPEAARTRPDAGAARTMLLRAAFARKRGQVLAAVAASSSWRSPCGFPAGRRPSRPARRRSAPPLPLRAAPSGPPCRHRPAACGSTSTTRSRAAPSGSTWTTSCR